MMWHRDTCVWLLAAWFLAGMACAAQEEPTAARFDHTLYVRIESEPPGADIYAVSAISNKVSEKIGVAPCVAVVGLIWDRQYGRRDWPSVTAYSPGDPCAVVYDPEKKIHEIYFSCAAVKQGYHATNVRSRVAALMRPGIGWDTDDWPDDVGIGITLAPKAEPVPPQTDSSAPALQTPKVILATSGVSSPELGEMAIRCDVGGAAAYVDGKLAGKPPVDVMLPEGTYRIEVKKAGYRTFAEDVSVHYGSRKTVPVTLEPAENAE